MKLILKLLAGLVAFEIIDHVWPHGLTPGTADWVAMGVTISAIVLVLRRV